MKTFAKKMTATAASFALAAGLCPGLAFAPAALADDSVPMYRLYNPNSGEHFYTADTTERNGLVRTGWDYEAVGWYAPNSGGNPVYRLYNANGGEHHYTMDAAERDDLVSVGWNDEGVGWHSDDDDESVPLYRQYNPNAFSCNHNYTASESERDWLLSQGWRDEGVSWSGAAVDDATKLHFDCEFFSVDLPPSWVDRWSESGGTSEMRMSMIGDDGKPGLRNFAFDFYVDGVKKCYVRCVRYNIGIGQRIGDTSSGDFAVEFVGSDALTSSERTYILEHISLK